MEPTKDDLIVVAGAGGFIGGHLVASLRQQGFTKLRAVDIKPLDKWYQLFDDVENLQFDLRKADACIRAAEGAHDYYNFAADMGGMGFIENNKALCMISVLINTHSLMAAAHTKVQRYFFSSSACVYNTSKQMTNNGPALRESDAYPALPEDGYGWEKLFSERMCRHFTEDFSLCTRVARYHNVYGQHGTFAGGREKAPAAICRKVIEAKLAGSSEIEIWGDGTQTRSFMYIEDCIEGTLLIMNSAIGEPINLGSSQFVSINQLVDIVERIAGVKLRRRYDLTAPRGVDGRNSDNTMIQDRLGWEPTIALEVGLEATYRWIYDKMSAGILVT